MLTQQNQKYGLLIGILIVLLYVSPYVILEQDSYVTIHDNLDSVFTYYIVLAENYQILDPDSVIMQTMNRIALKEIFGFFVAAK